MRAFITATATTAALVLTTTAGFAQTTERGYLEGAGGFAVSPDTTSGDVQLEAGVRVAPHLLVFGDLGQFHNLRPSELQPLVDATSASLATSSGLNVTGIAHVPAWYELGGLRFEVPTRRVSPYVFGGAGFARLTPRALFTYTSGPLSGLSPSVGDDVTQQIISMSGFTTPAATQAFAFSFGGGAAIPVADHWAIDAGYRFSRVATDTPLNTQGATFGLGYRF